jgi:hypothetical protein
MGPPFHVPDPKSALSPADVPMLDTHADDCEWTGSADTSACQKEVAGVREHDGAPGTGPPCAIAAAAKATTSRSRPVRRTATIVGH